MKGFKKSAALAMAVLYLAGNVVLSHAYETNLWSERKKAAKSVQMAQLPDLLRHPGNLLAGAQSFQSNKTWIPAKQHAGATSPLLQALPHTYGSIRGIQKPHAMSAGTIIHLQDVHLNDEAQLNISRTVQSLIDSKQIDFVALEGSSGPVELKLFRDFPHQDAVKIAADYLLKEKEISGPIYSALTSSTKIPAFLGIDDPVHYQNNIDAYRASHTNSEEVKRQLATFEKTLSQNKKSLFSPTLLTFDALATAHQKGEVDLGAYLQRLVSQGEELSMPLTMYLEAWTTETKLNFSLVESERKTVVAQLVQEMSETESKEFLNLSVAYRLGEIRQTDFYNALRTLCKNHDILLERYPHLTQYIQYVLLADQIQPERLFADLRTVEEGVYSRLAKTEEEKNLIAQSKWLGLATKLVNFSLTREEWGEYQSMVHIPWTIDHKNLKSFEDFYFEALARDERMAANTLRAMANAKNKVGVLVTGGFHSAGINKAMKEAGLTTITFVPKLTRVDDTNGSSYLSVFDQEKTPLEQLFEGEKLFLAKAPLTSRNRAIVLTDAAEQQLNPGSQFSLIPGFAKRILSRTAHSLTIGLKNVIVRIGFGEKASITKMTLSRKPVQRTRERIQERFGDLTEWKVRLLAPLYEVGQVFLPWFLFLHTNQSVKDYVSRIAAQSGILFALFYWVIPFLQPLAQSIAGSNLSLVLVFNVVAVALISATVLHAAYEVLTLAFPRLLSPLTTSAPNDPDDGLVDVSVSNPLGGDPIILKVSQDVKDLILKIEKNISATDLRKFKDRIKNLNRDDETDDTGNTDQINANFGLAFRLLGEESLSDNEISSLGQFLYVNHIYYLSEDADVLQFRRYLFMKVLFLRAKFKGKSDPSFSERVKLLDAFIGAQLRLAKKLQDEDSEPFNVEILPVGLQIVPEIVKKQYANLVKNLAKFEKKGFKKYLKNSEASSKRWRRSASLNEALVNKSETYLEPRIRELMTSQNDPEEKNNWVESAASDHSQRDTSITIQGPAGPIAWKISNKIKTQIDLLEASQDKDSLYVTLMALIYSERVPRDMSPHDWVCVSQAWSIWNRFNAGESSWLNGYIDMLGSSLGNGHLPGLPSSQMLDENGRIQILEYFVAKSLVARYEFRQKSNAEGMDSVQEAIQRVGQGLIGSVSDGKFPSLDPFYSIESHLLLIGAKHKMLAADIADLLNALKGERSQAVVDRELSVRAELSDALESFLENRDGPFPWLQFKTVLRELIADEKNSDPLETLLERARNARVVTLYEMSFDADEPKKRTTRQEFQSEFLQGLKRSGYKSFVFQDFGSYEQHVLRWLVSIGQSPNGFREKFRNYFNEPNGMPVRTFLGIQNHPDETPEAKKTLDFFQIVHLAGFKVFLFNSFYSEEAAARTSEFFAFDAEVKKTKVVFMDSPPYALLDEIGVEAHLGVAHGSIDKQEPVDKNEIFPTIMSGLDGLVVGPTPRSVMVPVRDEKLGNFFPEESFHLLTDIGFIVATHPGDDNGGRRRRSFSDSGGLVGAGKSGGRRSRPKLVRPSTREAGRALGLSDDQIRTEYAPVVEALDVLNPWRFWKAHAELNDGGQWKRLRGIAQIWLAMMWTSALPGFVIGLGILVGRLVVQYQVPTWLYWAPPVITMVGSIGWGYVLLILGYSQKLLTAKNPRDITRSPLFRPFRSAFKGNRIEHRFWNTEHPDAALVEGGKGKRPRDHAQLQHLATQVSEAQVLADAGDFEKAIEKLERILAMKGSMVAGYREVARRERNGQLKRAVLEAETLLEEWREAFVAALQKRAENSAFHTEYFSAIVALQHVIKVEKIRLANVSNHILVHELDEHTIDLQKQYHDSRIKEAEMKIASWRPELLQHIKAGAVGDTAKLFHDVITNAEALGLDNRHTAVLTAYKKLYEKHINVTLERISAEYQVISKNELLVFIRKDLAPRVDGVLDLNLKDSAQAAEEENRLLAGMTLEIIYQEITKPASTKRPEDFDELVNLVITFTHADESKVKEHLGAMGIVGQRMFLEIHEGRWELHDGRLRPSPAYMAEAKAGPYKITYSTSRKWVRHSALSTKQDVLLSKLKEMVANGKIGNKQFDFKISPVDLGDDFIAYVRWFEGSKKGVIVLLDTIGNITRRGTLTTPVMEHLDRISQLPSDKTLRNEPIYIPVTPPGGSTRAYSLPVGPVLGLSALLMSVLLAPAAPLLSLVLTVLGAFVLFPDARKLIVKGGMRAIKASLKYSFALPFFLALFLQACAGHPEVKPVPVPAPVASETRAPKEKINFVLKMEDHSSVMQKLKYITSQVDDMRFLFDLGDYRFHVYRDDFSYDIDFTDFAQAILGAEKSKQISALSEAARKAIQAYIDSPKNPKHTMKDVRNAPLRDRRMDLSMLIVHDVGQRSDNPPLNHMQAFSTNSTPALEPIATQPENTATVMQAEYSIATFGENGLRYLQTFGLAPCMSLVLWDPTTKTTFMSHIDALTDKETLAPFIKHVLGKRGVDVKDMKAFVIGGTAPDPSMFLKMQIMVMKLGLPKVESYTREIKYSSVVIDMETGTVFTLANPAAFGPFVIDRAEAYERVLELESEKEKPTPRPLNLLPAKPDSSRRRGRNASSRMRVVDASRARRAQREAALIASANTITNAFVLAHNPNASADDVAAGINALIGSEKARGVGRRQGALTSLSTRDRDEVLRLVESKLKARADWKGLPWMRARGVVTRLDGVQAQEPAVLIGNKNVALDVRVQAPSDLDDAVALINKTKRSMGRGVLYVPVRQELEGELKTRLIQTLGPWDGTIQFVISESGFYQGQKFNLDAFLPAIKTQLNSDDLGNVLLAISGDYTVSDALWKQYTGRHSLKMILLVELLNGVFRAMPMDHATLQKIDRFARLAATSA